MLDQTGLNRFDGSSSRNGTGRAIVALLFVSLALASEARAQPRLAGELDAAGLRQTLARQKGRVVLLNFWATWCVPCREEFPELSKLQGRLGPAGLQIIGVSTDFAKQRAAVGRFLARQRPPFPNYRKKSSGDDQDFIEAVDRSWGGELPFSVLYDRSGKKSRVYSGSLPLADAEKEIRKLLASR
ncbi:MAG TPA: redoxin domain-containing protein [Thermoanaerobaculia bacterium]